MPGQQRIGTGRRWRPAHGSTGGSKAFSLSGCVALPAPFTRRYPFCGVEGFECLAGGVVVGAGAEGGADAVTVKLLAHRVQDGADGEAGVSFTEVFDDAGEDRRRGEVDVADGRAVKNHPP
jgi:hypothetical protein